VAGPQVLTPTDPRSNGTPQLYLAQQWGANSVYVQTDDFSYRAIHVSKLAGDRMTDDIGGRADTPPAGPRTTLARAPGFPSRTP
jgi:hypothetical protein